MKRKCRLHVAFVSVVFLLLFAVKSHSELITVQFAGTVTSVSVQNRPQLAGYEFPHVGDAFTGYYKFDSIAPESANSPDEGVFYTTLPDTAVHVSIGTFQFNGSADGIVTTINSYSVGDWIPPIELT